jgi:lipopolysaccharide export system permease protein
MPLIERYILRRAAQIFLLTLGAAIGTLWLTQVLRELDVVTAKGQAVWVFLLMTVLALPVLVQIVAPIAFLVAAVVTLNGLTADSELPVISAAGASRKAVNRPILALGVIVMLAVGLSHHVLAPASLSGLRAVLTRVRADVIATLVQDGGFRSVEDGLTMHIREKAPDGTFAGIFVNDDRDPNLSLQYSAAHGTLLERGADSFLVLQDGDLIREDRLQGENNVVDFETYALDLSDLGAPDAAAFYKAKERSTLYLLEPEADDPFFEQYPERVTAELHDRTTAPLYTLAFAFIALAFLGRPRTSRQDRSFAIAVVVLSCLALRAAGLGAVAVAGTAGAGIPFMYAIPLGGIAFGVYATVKDVRMRIPRFVESAWDAAARSAQRTLRRFIPQESGAEGGSR